jgi:hypothetical protein
VQQNFEDACDEWSAMQAVVKLEMLLELRTAPTSDKSLGDNRLRP